VIVDGQVHGVPANAAIAVLPLPRDAVTHAADSPQTLGVDVKQLAGCFPFVAAHWFDRLQRSQPG
jgi:hypothetical protein